MSHHLRRRDRRQKGRLGHDVSFTSAGRFLGAEASIEIVDRVVSSSRLLSRTRSKAGRDHVPGYDDDEQQDQGHRPAAQFPGRFGVVTGDARALGAKRCPALWEEFSGR
jgi:hypothetical protein